MKRRVTLNTGQWADCPVDSVLDKARAYGYDGVELCCWGDQFEVERAIAEPDYCNSLREKLEVHKLGCWSISNHLAGQLVCDNLDQRHNAFVPAHLQNDWPEMHAWAIEAMKNTARAAQGFGVPLVNGFTGSSIWHFLYSFPPVSAKQIERGFEEFAERWNPILDVFDECGVRFALEVHPTEIAFDIYSTHRALEAIGYRESFGFNFDPSHFIWQGMDPCAFIREFPDRIYHVHMKDAAVTLDGRSGILSSHLAFGDARRGWDFRSVGCGDVDFEAIVRALDDIGYEGPLSVEWEDSGMDRDHGARESCAYVKSL
ncbi:MAG: sugar phosphate isomerase/epimerase [Candidatus Hydrogenedentota bacterium]